MNDGAMEDGRDRIAVIGMSGRFPGAGNVSEFWKLLEDGVEAIRFFTPAELEEAGVPGELARDPSYVPANGYLDGIEFFDASFFGMTPREAEITDPQHRLFLESSWHALENAGHVAEHFDGRIGVYAGCGLSTYLLFHLFRNPHLPSVNHLQFLMGNSNDYLPSRVSYKLNLKGPSVNVNTACSSSLVAVHMACQALLDFECDIALAGGAGIQLPQQQGYLYEENSITSPDGHCRAFDARAGGTVSGNGVGVVVLRRLEDSLADGDAVRAVILGSAINNDGADKVGYTAPSVEGQASVISEALSVAGVDPETIHYIETHGTGTRVGDPIEIEALSRAFGRNGRKSFCALGSVKTNIGHLDEAAGIAGLIKAILAIEHAAIPPSLHFESPNPEIDFENSPFFVNERLRSWPSTDGPRRAGISSFGIGGTNAHVVLEEAPPFEEQSANLRFHVVPVSAQTEAALGQAKELLANHLEANPRLSPDAVAYTLQSGRKAFAHRDVACGRTLEEIVRGLRSRQSRSNSHSPDHGRALTFMFPGQGAQHPGMSAELYETESFFREELDRCLDLLRQQARTEPPSFLSADDAAAAKEFSRTDSAQTALFSVEFALARLWMHWGLEPDFLIGHSLGEYVAACISGVFSLEEGMRIVLERGRLMQSMPAGTMLALPLPERDVWPHLSRQLDLAAVNGPESCVVSGPELDIDSLEKRLLDQGVAGRRLATSHAFHSRMMEPILGEFEEVMRSVSLSAPRIPIVSNTTGRLLSSQQATDPSYWMQHARKPVMFAAGVDLLLEQGCRMFLEVGPSNVLSKITGRLANNATVIPSLPHPREELTDQETLARAAGRLWTQGIDVDWQTSTKKGKTRPLELPAYPFARDRHWVDIPGRQSATIEPPQQTAGTADLDDWFYQPSWRRDEGFLDDSAQPASCLVFHSDDALEVCLREALERTGTTVYAARPGDRFQQLEDRRFTIRVDVFEDYATLIDQCDDAPDLVLHLWTLPGNSGPDQGLDLGFYSLLYLAQSLTRKFVNPSGRWLVCSPPCYEVTGTENLAPVHAALSGITAVIPLEFPALACRHIDLDADDLQMTADQIQREIRIIDSPGLAAWRNGERWIRAWDQLDLPRPVRYTAVKAGGTYLITGGLGSMGLAFAEYMGGQAPCRIVLTGRSDFPEREQWKTVQTAATLPDAASPSLAVSGMSLLDQVEGFEREAERRHDIRTLDQMPELTATLDELAASLVSHGLFGPLLHDRKTRTREEWKEVLQVVPKFDRFFDYLLSILIEDGVLSEGEGELRLEKLPHPPESIHRLLEEHCAPYVGLAGMLRHCGDQYADVISGRVNPLQVLYPDGTDRLFAEYSHDLPAYTSDPVYLYTVACLVREAAQAKRVEPLRVLEVGGGTGALTEVVLEATDGVAVDYTFTDLGTSFVTRAEEEARKRGYPDMRFRALDISRDPVEQGFAEESYDIVIGYNVVHATPDIRQTLRNLARVLAQGGLLGLVETVKSSRQDNMIWGLTDGWWIYEDTDLRAQTPILSLDQWDRALEIEEFIGRTFPRSVSARSATAAGLIVAHRERSEAEAPVPARDLHKTCRTIRRITAIEQTGSTVEYIRADAADPNAMDHLRNHIRTECGTLDGIVHTAGELGQGFLSQKSKEDVARTFSPKIHATAALEDLLQEFGPSFLMLCSSMSSIAPIIGQADYASANAFLDAYAHAADGKFDTRVVSITWGFWQELGMIGKARGNLAQQQAMAAQIQQSNLRDAGVRAFARILENPSPAQVVVAPDGLEEETAVRRSSHPWFDEVVRVSDDILYLQGSLSPDSSWVLDEHQVLGKKILPGTAYLEMARAAAAEGFASAPAELREVYFLRPLIVDRGEITIVRTVLQRQDDGWNFMILSQSSAPEQDEWVEHTRGEIRRATGREKDTPPKTLDVEAIQRACDRESPASTSSLTELETFQASMSTFGPHWHNLVQAHFGQDQALGEFELHQRFVEELDQFHLHPALLDNATGFLKVKEDEGPALPFSYRSIRLYDSVPGRAYSHVRRRSGENENTVSYDITIADPQGRVVVDIESYALRVVPQESATSRIFAGDAPENTALALGQRGSLSTFFFSPEPRREPAEGEVEIEIKATGLNFIEVLYSLGMLPHDAGSRFPYGLECAGIVRRSGSGAGEFRPGDEVVAFANGCFKAFAAVPVRAVAHKPEALSLEQAATLPAAYMTAWHSLTRAAQLVAGERVLIHSAAGGVGLAAVHVAKLLGAEVLATAGTEEKRQFLQSIGVLHVADSRSNGFGRQIMDATDGAGVDIVLNSLGEEFTGESLSVLARYGRFVELGKRAIFANGSLDLRPFERQLTFTAVDVGPDLPQFANSWKELMGHIHTGALPPLPFRAFQATNPAEGFEYMARGHHIGKIVFTFGPPQELLRSASQPSESGRSFSSIVGLETDSTETTAEARTESSTEEEAEIPSDLATDTEKGVARIWRDLLGTSSIRRHDNFFDLNGDSLLAAQVISQIHREFGVKLPFSSIFDAPSVEELALEIDKSGNGAAPPAGLDDHLDDDLEEGVI